MRWCKARKAGQGQFYAQIFNTHFNLNFHRPWTHVICDKLQLKIDHGNAYEKQQAGTQKQLHLRKAEAATLAKDAFHILKVLFKGRDVFSYSKNDDNFTSKIL